MNETQKCPICLFDVAEISPAQQIGDGVRVECKDCGRYEMEGSTVKRFLEKKQDFTPHEEQFFPDLPKYIQSKNQEGSTPELGPNWTAYVRAWKQQERQRHS